MRTSGLNCANLKQKCEAACQNFMRSGTKRFLMSDLAIVRPCRTLVEKTL